MQIFEGFFIVANAASRNMLLFRSNSPPARRIFAYPFAKIRLREENILLPSVAYFAKEEVATFYL